MSNRFIPASYIFSYWIFAWVAIYLVAVVAFQIKPTTASFFNPFLTLFSAALFNLFFLIRFFVTGKSWWILTKYAIIIFVIKAVPLYFLWKVGGPVKWAHSILSFLVVFAGYCAYLQINRTDPISVYKDLTESEEKDENRTPFEYWITRTLQK